MSNQLMALRACLGALVALCVAHVAHAQATQEQQPQPQTVQIPAEAPPPAPPVPVAVAPPPAPIQEGNAAAMQNCDGYGDAQGSGDGMTQQGLSIWSVGGDRMRRQPSFQHGVEYCTRALARIDGEFPQFWMRKVSLLQSRALHRLLASDTAGAIADLDLAAAAAQEPGDRYFVRSLAFNSGVIRAYTQIEAGDRAGGEALAMQMHANRPYSREAVGAALLAIGPDGSSANIETLLRAAGRLDPSRSNAIYTYLFESGRFADAIAYYDELKSPTPIYDQTYDQRRLIQNEQQQRVIDELFWQHAMGRRAYALAALGRADDARVVLAEAEARFGRATPALPLLPPRATNTDRLRLTVHEQMNLEIQTRSPPIRMGWASLVNARILAGEGKPAEARDALRGEGRIPPSTALLDLADAIEPRPDRAARNLPASLLGLPGRDVRLLFTRLLDAETERRSAGGVSMWDRPFVSRDADWRGACTENNRNRDDGLYNVCAKGFDATPPVTEERALLRAAARAAEAGFSHFVIESRYDIRHSIVNTMYGVALNESPAGFESRLDVRFLNDPPENCWRCFDVAQVRADLEAIYGPVPAAQTPRQPRRERERR